MLEVIITSSVLIIIVTALRFALRGRLSPTVIYAMWAVVALRLLVPVSIADTRVSVMNLFERAETVQTEQATHTDGEIPLTADSAVPQAASPDAVGEVLTVNGHSQALPQKSASVSSVLTAVWLVGTAVALAFIITVNLRFAYMLRKSRRSMDGVSAALPVYVVDVLSSPCIFGVVRPAIYLNEFAAGDFLRAGYVITHELTHYRHCDHIWAAVRVLCLALYWFDPLVWLAAYLSRQDSELACDSSVVKSVGEAYRIEYGRTLVDMINVRFSPADALMTSTTMSSGARSIRERIMTIKSKPRTVVWAAVTLCAVIAAAFAVTFTGAVGLNSSAAELPVYADFTILGSGVSGREIHDEDDIGFLLSLLDTDGMERVAPENIPAESQESVVISFLYDYFAHYTITGDGYVIFHDMSGSNSMLDKEAEAELVNIDTGNVASGEYFEGHYGFFRLSGEQLAQLNERLEAMVSGGDEDNNNSYPDLLAEYTTYYNAANLGRSQNIQTAVEYIDGTVLQPGEEFSFNGVVGERTPERGFVKATVYTFENSGEDYGGGISQAATTLYNAAVMGGMDISAHQCHMYTVNYTLDADGQQSYGNDAIVSWGTCDLGFVNRTAQPVLIRMSCENGAVTARLYGTSNGVSYRIGTHEILLEEYSYIYRRPYEGCVNQSGQLGRTVEVYYLAYADGVHNSSTYAYTAYYFPLPEVIYTDDIPEGYEYDVAYTYYNLPTHESHDMTELWAAPEYQYLLEGVPMPEHGELTYFALHRKGEEITHWGSYNLQGSTPELDLLVMMVSGMTQRQRLEYLDALREAGFTYHADDGSGDEDGLCVLYNAPQYGVGVQLELLSDTMTIIFFPQGDGCYGYSEPVPKG